MFNFLGRLASNHPWKILAAWLVVGLGLTWAAPRWEKNAQDDDIRFLPGRCESVKGYRLLEQAFPRDVYASRVIFALERSDAPLTPDDCLLIKQIVGDLDELREKEPELKLGRVASPEDAFVGKRMLSKDQHCALIQLSLGTPYLAMQTRGSVDRAEAVVRKRLKSAGASAPTLFVTGPAGVGRDLISASASSLDHTTIATVVLVIGILLLVYRAPLLALVPLVTIAISVWVALSLLALCTLIPGFYLVNISQVFAIVMLYGAGTDYCLFLISRYREELSLGNTPEPSLQRGVGKVGGALAASAGTVICGLGLMGLAEFAKVRCGGPAIALSLAVALVASLTLTPALLRLLGRGVFWPTGVATVPEAGQTSGDLWSRVSRQVVARPLAIWVSAVVLLLPLAFLGFQVRANYRATGELAPSSSSVQGLAAIQRHFTAGETGPVSVLLASRTSWHSKESQALLVHLSHAMARLENVAEVRSLTQPLGEPVHELTPSLSTVKRNGVAGFMQKMRRGFATTVDDQIKLAAQSFYVSTMPRDVPEIDWLQQPATREGPVHVTRLDIILHSDPFDPRSIPTLDVIQAWIKKELPRSVRGLDGLQAESYGVTVSSRDLAEVTETDRARINALVLGGIFLILLVLVRKLWLAAYLLATVLLSYYATLGATTLMATWFAGRPLGEVDWRVPFFLFTILVAVGEDYNILLISRALKERKRHGGKEGMRRALARTGGTITSCGLIMAGTFATLMLSGLNTLIQIGFALAFGVLLDTFVVRPFLVPAFTMMVWLNEAPPAERPMILEMSSKGKRRAA
jgi:RND superfamily putative drug exporter